MKAAYLSQTRRPVALHRAQIAVVVLLVVACWKACAADDSPQLLQEWPIAGDELPATVFFWHREALDIEAEAQANPAAAFPGGLGVCSVHITASPRAGAADIQLNPLARQGPRQGRDVSRLAVDQGLATGNH